MQCTFGSGPTVRSPHSEGNTLFLVHIQRWAHCLQCTFDGGPTVRSPHSEVGTLFTVHIQRWANCVKCTLIGGQILVLNLKELTVALNISGLYLDFI